MRHGVGALAQPREGIRAGLLRIVAAAPRLAAGGPMRSARSLARSRIAVSTAGQFFSCSAVSFSPALRPAMRASVNAATSSVLGREPRAFARRSLLRERKTCARERESDRSGNDFSSSWPPP